MLGRRNPLERLGRTVLGWLRPEPDPGASGPRAIRLIGHRGAARVCCENTIGSFETALTLGADGIETDICVTRDGTFLLWHDADPSETVALARAAGREYLLCTPDVPTLVSKWRRPIRDLDYADFRRHYGYRPRKGGIADLAGDDEPPEIPAVTLEEFLEYVAREPRLATVCLDVKLAPRQADAARILFVRIAEFLASRRGDFAPVFRFLSPQEEIVRALLEESRSRPSHHAIVISADFELPGVAEAARSLGVRNVSMGLGRRSWPDFRDEVAATVRERENGRIDSVFAWTINEPDRLRELVAFGVDGILTDDAPLLRMILQRRPPERLG